MKIVLCLLLAATIPLPLVSSKKQGSGSPGSPGFDTGVITNCDSCFGAVSPPIVTAGSKRALIIAAFATPNTTVTISSVIVSNELDSTTHTATLLHRTNFTDATDVALFYYIAPDASTNRVHFSTTGQAINFNALVHHMTNVNQSTPFGTSVASASDSTAVDGITNTVTAVSGNLVFDMVASSSFNRNVVLGSGQTQALGSTNVNAISLFSSTKLATGTSETMYWTVDNATIQSAIAVAIKP